MPRLQWSLVLGLGGVALALACGRATPPAAAQPVPFSHRVHAGVNQIGCGMCHSYAWRSPIAGIPSGARCHGCHKFVDKDKPDIQLINKAFDEGKLIVWNRVYRVPDHVYFTHERHVAAAVQCQQCHGPVEQMDVIQREAPLTMGWCVECHRRRKAETDCVTCHK